MKRRNKQGKLLQGRGPSQKFDFTNMYGKARDARRRKKGEDIKKRKPYNYKKGGGFM